MTTLDLTTLTLAAGGHRPGSNEMCLLEAVSYIAGEPWSDQPVCVSPVLGAYGRSLNDMLPYETRQRLVPLIPRLLNTAGDGFDGRRSYMALDWLTRTYLPAWLRLVPALTTQADLLAAAHEVVDLDTAAAISDLVREAASQSAAAWNAVQFSVEAIAWVADGAARSAAWDAARSAAGDAANGAARDAARSAAGDTNGDTAGDVARSATRSAAGAATRSAARSAAGYVLWASSGRAAGAAAEAFLAPTVAALQKSSVDLFDRMLTVTK